MQTSDIASDSLQSDLRSDANTITQSAKQRLQSEVDARKGAVASQLKVVSSAAAQAGDGLADEAPQWLRSVLGTASRTTERLAQTLEQKDARALAADADRMARQYPQAFLATCAFVGFGAARILKAGAQKRADVRANYGRIQTQPAVTPSATTQAPYPQGNSSAGLV